MQPITAPLWSRARASYQRALAAIGAPAAIAAIAQLTTPLRRFITRPIAKLEHIVRKLLLTEAAAIQRARSAALARAPRLITIPLHTPHHAPALHARAHSIAAKPDLNRPESWRASFAFATPRDPHLVSEANAPRIRALWGPTPPPAPPPARALRSLDPADTPFRLARRFEALRRVLENPAPYARRLAALLARGVKRFAQLVRRYAFAPARTNYYDPDDPKLGVDAIAAGLDAPNAFPDSS